jgi:fructokinase
MPINVPTAVGLGEVLWDLLPSGKQLGGAPANFAYHAQAVGGRSSVVSAVGEDELGREIISRLSDLRLDVSSIAVDPNHPTGTVSVTLDAAGVPSYIIHTDVAWDHISQTPALDHLARRTDAVCFGTLAQRSEQSRRTIHAFLCVTRPECLRIFDINLRQRFYDELIIQSSLDLASILKINDEELPIVADLLALPRHESECIPVLLERFELTLIALTRGGRGASLYTHDEAAHHDGYPTTVIDTVGAGDAFTAALAIGLLKHQPLAVINDRANRLAAYVCSQPGATPPVPAEFAW